MDKVLFFKVHFYLSSAHWVLKLRPSSLLIIHYSMNLKQMGKFYELYEMDAHVGAKELYLQYMKV
jgi:hypothetical protein